jgi:hypothetical protein
MSNRRVRSVELGESPACGSMVARLLRPSVVAPVFVGIALTGAMLPWLVGYGPYEQRAIDQQIDREDSALCEKFEFSSGTTQHSTCKADLAELRHRHERLLLR